MRKFWYKGKLPGFVRENGDNVITFSAVVSAKSGKSG